MLEVLFVNHSLDFRSGGGERVLHDLLSALDSSRFHASLVAPAAGSSTDFEAVADRVYPLPPAHFGESGRRQGWARVAASLARLQWALWRILGLAKPDIVHVNSIFALHFAVLPCWLRGVPVVYHEHNLIDQRRDSLWQKALPLLLRGVSRTVAITDAVRSQLIAFGVRAESVETIYNGVDPTDSPASPREPCPRSFQADAFVIGQVANLHRWKGHETVIRAARRVLEAAPQARVVFLGGVPDEAYAAELRRLVAALELESVIEFAGFREDVASLIPQLSCLVVASDAEPFGLALVEAMAAGVPVVATAAGGIGEIIEDGTSGLQFPPGDADALAAALIALADDAELRARLIQNGALRARDFSLAAQATRLSALFEKLASRSVPVR